MCSEASHQSLKQPEHFTRHAMDVEQFDAATRHGRVLGAESLSRAIESAQDALSLADKDVPAECTRMLRLTIERSLHAAAS